MITFLLTSLLGVMLLGIPILISIALIGFVGMAMLPGVVMPLFAQKMFGQLDSFTLLAMPYFILAGSIMTAGGISKQLVDFARASGGAFSGRARTCLGRGQHGDVGRLGIVHGRRLGDRVDPHPDHEAIRLQAGFRRGPHRHRRNDGGDHSAEHDDGGLWRHRAGLDRRTVPRRHHSRHPDRSGADDRPSSSTPIIPPIPSFAK